MAAPPPRRIAEALDRARDKTPLPEWATPVAGVLAVFLAAGLAIAAIVGLSTGPPATTSTRPVQQAVASSVAPTTTAKPIKAAKPTAPVQATGRAFLTGYLDYLYGFAPASVIHDASPALLHRLEARPVSGKATTKPTIGQVSVVSTGATSAQVSAEVGTSPTSSYALYLTLTRSSGASWQVSTVGTAAP
ncbi:MAG: hypothetical protein ACRD0J_09440 [Acidimicrobiales bacterium]